MEKTAMKQFLDWHWAEYERGNRPSHYEIAQWCAINGLPIEKNNIVEAVNYGNRQECYDGTEEIGNDYYNTKFTNNNKTETILHSKDGANWEEIKPTFFTHRLCRNSCWLFSITKHQV